MQAVAVAPADSSAPGGARLVEVAAGLAGGVRIHGLLRLPETWRIADMLNNVGEPVLTLEGGRDSPVSALTVTRANLVWMYALGDEPAGNGDNDLQGVLSDHAVVVHAGPFELRGTISTHAGVNWSNFLVGRAGPPAQFFVLTDAHIDTNPTALGASLAVNVALVGAILSAR